VPSPDSRIERVSVRIFEVGPRDGLQNHSHVLTPQVRAELIDRLSQTGVGAIEIGSFVHPGRVPQMAGVEEVASLITARKEVRYAGLVLNDLGYERLRETQIDEVRIAFAASATFNERNQGSTIEDSLATAQRIIARAHADDRRASVTLATAFGCPFEGELKPEQVLRLAEHVVEAEADEVLLADTIGVAVPREVRSLVQSVLSFGVPVGLHLHNTRNTGYANALAGLEAGASTLDASIGGIGGCPFAPKATGNIATEDLAYLLHGEGVETGIDLDSLLVVCGWLEDVLERQLDGLVHRADAFSRSAA